MPEHTVPDGLLSMIWMVGDIWLIVEASVGSGYHWGVSRKPYSCSIHENGAVNIQTGACDEIGAAMDCAEVAATEIRSQLEREAMA